MSVLAMLDVSSGEPDGCELLEAGARMLMVLLIRCDWCWVVDTAGNSSGLLLLRDGPVYGGIRTKARGEESLTLRLDAVLKLSYAVVVGASKPKYDSKSAVFGPKNEGSVAAGRSRKNEYLSVQ